MLLRNLAGVFLCIYLRIVNVSCNDGSSLAFAIDDTASMYDDISYVKKEAREILNLVLSKKSNIDNLVLVTFNDPDVELRTTSASSSQSMFLSNLNAIRPHDGDDCPEMSLTGIKTALEASGPESNVYVFTDANAKDYYELNKTKSLCQKKQSQVVIVYSKDTYCHQPYGIQFDVYFDLAKACSGQVFIVEKNEVHSILKAIEILLQGKQSIFKWIMVPRTNEFIPIEFTLDEKAEYAVVSTSGQNVKLKVTREKRYFSPEVYLKRVMWNKNGKVVKLINPAPGTYYAWVKGKSAISVVVYGRTDFTFQHGFSVLQPKLLSDASKQPIAGLKQYLSINVTDPDHAVDIQKIQILDVENKDHIVDEKYLRKIGENFYITEPFVSPSRTFKIAVIGETKVTHETITRSSKNINPQFVDLIPESVPTITIKEGKRALVNYGSEVALTCKVTAHPAPKIEWYTSSGRKMTSKSSVVDDPEFVSYLNLKDIKHDEVYYCDATNKKGHSKESIQVSVKPIFVIVGTELHNAKYGEDAKILCNIESYLPFKRIWFRDGRQLNAVSNGHSISLDGSELTLKSMDIAKQGKYTCEAILISDQSIRKTHDRNVKLSDIASPKITSGDAVVRGKSFTAVCRVTGVPRPTITWQFKPKGSNVYRSVPGSEEKFVMTKITLRDSGSYKCIVKNILGQDSREFKLEVEEPPVIQNQGNSFYAVEGDEVVKIPCNVTGYPEPIVVWKNNGKVLKTNTKYKFQENNLYIYKPQLSDSGEYTCEASNKLGTDKKKNTLDVVDYFDGDNNFNGNTHEVYIENGKPTTIKCNLKHVGEKSVRWYLDGMLTKHTGSVYTIEKTSMSNEGNYTCRVNTNEGSTSETHVVYVGYPPIFEDSISSPILVNWEDVDQFLDCAAESQPAPKYEWFHNKKPLGSGNDFKELDIIDWGEYTCQVSNKLGKISRNFKVTTSGCYITKNTIPQNQPLLSDVMTPKWSSFIGKRDILIGSNNEIKLSCPNSKYSINKFKLFPNRKDVIAKCVTRDEFTVGGRTYKYSDFQCNSKVEPSLLHTRQQCSGPNTEMLQVRFEVNGFLDAYKVCYDNSLMVPLYASAAAIEFKKSHYGVNENKYEWTLAPEISGFKSGNWKPEGSCKCCYTKSQLVNVNELPFGPAQDASFKENLNSVPVWDPSCDDDNRISWHTFDNAIREISSDQKNWFIWTGASKYVLKDGGMVPRYLWKVIVHDEITSVMVYVNDRSPVESDIRCSKTCEPILETDKFLYCCTLDEFSKNFGVPWNIFQA